MTASECTNVQLNKTSCKLKQRKEKEEEEEEQQNH